MSKYSTRTESACDCRHCRTKNNVGDLVMVFVSIGVMGLVWWLAR